MKGKTFHVLSSTFYVLLMGCGQFADPLPSGVNLPSAQDITVVPPTSLPPPTPNNSSMDLVSKMAQAIDTPAYTGKLVFSLKDYSSIGVVKKRHPEIQFQSKFGDPVLLDQERRRLEKVTGKSLPDLRRHIVVEEKDKIKAKAIFEKLARDSLVEVFYPRLKGNPPNIASVRDLTGLQGYLTDLNIPAVWGMGVKGENTSIEDGNDDVNPDHGDLPKYPGLSSLDSGSSRAIAHGTADFGILVGLDNGHGIKGIAPAARAGNSFGDAAGIAAVMNGWVNNIRPSGFIHLLEEQYPNPFSFPYSPCSPQNQTDCVSAEFYRDSFEAYQIATAFGVPVILPAANGSINMDTTQYVSGWPNLSRDDSGAIIVGASTGASHQKHPQSNCGRRVNLFAWGAGVVTTSYPGAGLGFDWDGPNDPNNGDPNLYYTNQFGGTSSAAAIVTGTVSLLQSYAMQQMGSTYKQLTPEKIREILVNSGISALNENDCSIGKQPKMDVAMSLFDNFWTQVQNDFSEIRNRQEIKGARRQLLRQRGIQLICNYHRPDLSDVNCPETAKCVLLPENQRPTELLDPRLEPTNCQGSAKPACIAIDYTQSDYDCAAGAIWPTGVEIAKPLDFDGDKKADLVSWTNQGWKIDLSSRNNLGAWDLQFNIPMTMGRWVWPVVEDYNSDGRADLAVWDKEHGVWYIKFTNNELLGLWTMDYGLWTWDWTITLPYHDELNRDVWQAKYSRPVPGDYNGDGWIDLALQTSDGYWRIDYGGPNRSDYGAFDVNTKFLTDQQLREAPGWAYLPVEGRFPQGGRAIFFKTPDGVSNGGKIIAVGIEGSVSELPGLTLGGNEAIPLLGHYGDDFGIKSPDGNWGVVVVDAMGNWTLQMIPPNGVYGGLECHPFLADFDGDDKDDRSVQCPSEFRIALNSTGQVLNIPLGYNTNQFTLPGKPYFGSVSYATVQQLIQWQLNSSNDPPIIPVDMVQTQFTP